MSGATTPGKRGLRIDGNKGVLHSHQSSSITGVSSSYCLVSDPGHTFSVGGYPTADLQSEYSTASVDWANTQTEVRE